MTEWPEAVMGEWAVIWWGEPGNQERGEKDERQDGARTAGRIPKQPGRRVQLR